MCATEAHRESQSSCRGPSYGNGALPLKRCGSTGNPARNRCWCCPPGTTKTPIRSPRRPAAVLDRCGGAAPAGDVGIGTRLLGMLRQRQKRVLDLQCRLGQYDLGAQRGARQTDEAGRRRPALGPDIARRRRGGACRASRALSLRPGPAHGRYLRTGHRGRRFRA